MQGVSGGRKRKQSLGAAIYLVLNDLSTAFSGMLLTYRTTQY